MHEHERNGGRIHDVVTLATSGGSASLSEPFFAVLVVLGLRRFDAGFVGQAQGPQAFGVGEDGALLGLVFLHGRRRVALTILFHGFPRGAIRTHFRRWVRLSAGWAAWIWGRRRLMIMGAIP